MPPPRPGSLHPVTLAPLAEIPWTDAADVGSIVARARAAQPAWAARTLAERSDLVRAAARQILEHRDAALDVLEQETGRAPAESLLGEVAFVLAYAKGAIRVARRALAPETVRLSPIDFPGKRATIEAVPRGVIGIIEPWNYPLLQFYKPLFPALLAGNAVVMKPSEHTPRSGAWLAAQLQAVLPEGLVQVLQGDGAIGAALVDADVDAVVFCGSVRAGRKVAMRCAERLIPCSVELGGKDAAIVLADCDLDRTVAGIAQWSMHNAGQDCSSIERVYVEDAIADRFVARLGGAVGRLQVVPQGSDLGPLQNAAQLEIVVAQVQAAVDQGALAVTGGAPTGAGYGYRPTVLDRCTPDMAVVTEETFGPVVAVVRVADADEAVRQANASRYGLCGSVWTRDRVRGEAIARRLEVGIALVNNHSFPGSIPSIPWTGTKHTGPGIAASRHAYHTFARRRTVVVDRARQPDVFWKPIDASLLALGHAASRLALGSVLQVFRLLPLLGRRVKAIRALVTGAAVALVLLAGCDPFSRWPDPGTVFPGTYTPLDDLQPYEEVRFETGTWVPGVDLIETALYVQKSLEHRAGAPIETLVHFGSSRPSGIVEEHPRLSFVGDVMPMTDRAPGFAAAVQGLLDGDLRMGNLETPVSSLHPTDRATLVKDYGLYAFNAPIDVLDGLPLDVLQLNNNHTMDLGVDGVLDTVRNVTDAGYVALGVDDNLALADVGDSVVVGLASYTWGTNQPLNDDVELFVVPFGQLDGPVQVGRIEDDVVRLHEAGATHVVLLLHWGFEYEYWPDPHFMELAREMIARGADVVVGSGPHTPQPAELCAVNQPLSRPGIGQCAVRSSEGGARVAAVLYSLGNFGTDLATLPLQVGIVGTVSLDPGGGVSGVGWAPFARIGSDAGFRLEAVDDLADDTGLAEAYAAESARLNRLLGTSWRRSR